MDLHGALKFAGGEESVFAPTSWLNRDQSRKNDAARECPDFLCARAIEFFGE